MANLRAFLTKLDEEMRQTSQDYRTATGNKKTTTLVYRSKEIRDALNTLMAANLNNSKDNIYFCEKYLKIINIDEGLMPYNPYDYQKQIMLSLLHI